MGSDSTPYMHLEKDYQLQQVRSEWWPGISIIKKCFIFLKEDITTAWEGIYANTKVYRWILFYLKITQKLDFITKHTLDLQAVTRGLRHFCWWKVWLAMALGAPGQLPLKLKSWLYALCSITLQLLARERDGEPGDSAEKGLPRIKPPLYPLFWYTELKKYIATE